MSGYPPPADNYAPPAAYTVPAPADGVKPAAAMDRAVNGQDNNNVDSLVPIFGYCCSMSSIQTTNIMGCTEKSVCLCIEAEGEFCTFINDREDACFNCTRQSCTCIQPRTCIKGVSRCFCCDSRCAFPCDDEVPCMLNVCFINCCYNWKCKFAACATIKTLKE